MKSSWLIQQLTQKPSSPFHAKASRAFGGGMLLLKDQAWDKLQRVFDFKYMGAAEYEFGQIPTTLQGLVRDREALVTFTVTVDRRGIQENFQHVSRKQQARRQARDAAKAAGVPPPRASRAKAPPFPPRTVYALCRCEHQAHVRETIRQDAQGKLQVRDRTRFAAALDPATDYDRETIGWFELDNGFFYFLDKDAFEGTCQLFLPERLQCLDAP